MNECCVACHKKTIKKILSKFKPQKDIAEKLKTEAEFIISNSKDLSAPYVALLINRLVKKSLGVQDLYNIEKTNANQLLLKQYDQWMLCAKKSSDSLHFAVKLAVVGNVIDYGAHSVPQDIEAAIEELVQQDFAIDQTEQLFQKIKNAKSILYLGDNAGEIVFDKLFIELLNHPNITYVVRGAPVINDVIEADAKAVGLEQVCNIRSNGHDAPSTLLGNCSEEFQNSFRKADLIISKGQGNFEGLMDESHPNLFFMLMVKCDFIANKLGVTKGDLVIKKSL